MKKTNPQRLDPNTLRSRVSFTFNQCLLCLYFYPGIWYDFAQYNVDVGNLDEAVNTYNRALQAIPDSLLLHFAFAEYYESQNNLKLAEAIYEKLLQKKSDPLVWIQYMRFARRAKGVEAARKVFFKC